MENSELKKLKPLWPEDDIQNRSKWLSNNLEGKAEFVIEFSVVTCSIIT